MPAILGLGKTSFTDANGAPLSLGNVYYYVPGTTTAKTTWSDSAGTVPNSNPVALDSRGQAVVWGSGSYRQIVQNSVGVTIWDQVVSSDEYVITTAMQPVVGAASTSAALTLLGGQTAAQVTTAVNAAVLVETTRALAAEATIQTGLAVPGCALGSYSGLRIQTTGNATLLASAASIVLRNASGQALAVPLAATVSTGSLRSE